MRGCGNAASTLASIKQWKRTICAEVRPFVRIAPGCNSVDTEPDESVPSLRFSRTIEIGWEGGN